MQFCSCLTWLTFVWRLRWIFDLEDHGPDLDESDDDFDPQHESACDDFDFNLDDDQWLISYLPMSGTTCEGTEFEVTSSNWLHKCTSVWGSKFAYIFCLDTKSDYNQLEGGSWQQVPTSRKRSEYLWKHWLVIRPVVRAISCDMRKRQRSQCRLIRRLSQDPQIRDTWFWGSKGISHDL